MKGYVFRSIKELVYLAMGIALYVAFSMTAKIPLIAHISTDMGYVVFGVFLVIFGWRAFIVGAVGCIFESLIFSGWFPLGWFLGQIEIGIVCGIAFKLLQKVNKKWLRYALEIIIAAIAIAIGIIGIKTAIECYLYSIPLAVKLVSNGIAALADFIPMAIGVVIADTVKDHVHITVERKKKTENGDD